MFLYFCYCWGGDFKLAISLYQRLLKRDIYLFYNTMNIKQRIDYYRFC